MNSDQRYELSEKIQGLQEQIAELTKELSDTIKQCDDLSYTADVIRTNIYSMLGVNGYTNGHSGDAQRAIDYLEDDDHFEDSDDELDDTPKVITNTIKYEHDENISDHAKTAATHWIEQNLMLLAIKDISTIDGVTLLEAKNKAYTLRDNLKKEAKS